MESSVGAFTSCSSHIKAFMAPISSKSATRYKTFLSRADSMLRNNGNISNEVAIVADSGATSTSIKHKHEFVELKLIDRDVKLDGIAEGLRVAGEGIVEYRVITDCGERILGMRDSQSQNDCDIPFNLKKTMTAHNKVRHAHSEPGEPINLVTQTKWPTGLVKTTK